ncbi:hypothetical protein WMF27_05965 [Sorangium sp. So ce281]|uniref:argonaute/piwi family protein n=1 Tax=unclassified Sorangium TaxID=2621164 RepID=UPI003F627672
MSAEDSSGSGLFLNAAVLDFGDASVEVDVLPRSNQLAELSRKHRETHVLRAERDEILAVPIVDGAPHLSDMRRVIPLRENPEFACNLWRESLLRRMVARQRPLVRGKPVQVLSTAVSDQIGPGAIWGPKSTHPNVVRAIDSRVAYGFAAQVLWPPAQPDHPIALPVVVLEVSIIERITASVAELTSQGVDLRGAYVGELEPISDERVLPELKLRGILREVVRAIATIEGDAGRAEKIDASQLRVEASRHNVRQLLEYALGRNRWMGASSDMKARAAAVHEGGSWVKRLQTAHDLLRKEPLEIVPGVQVTVGDLVNPARWPNGSSTVRRAEPAVFVFDAAGRKVHESSSHGIAAHGPYSRSAAIPRAPRICLICQASQQGVAEQLMYKFLHGIPNTVFSRGFLRTYGFENCQPVPFTTRDGSARAYHEAAQRALQAASDSRQPWDLAFVQVEDRTHQLRGDDNPYLVTKAFFLTQQIPIQQFRFETAQTPDNQLAFTLSNMGLATYAKLGGIPWLLRADPTTTHELVVGLASTWVRESRLSQGERLVGITTVFSGDGSYFLHTVSKAVSFDRYSVAMLESLRTSIDRVRRERNWQKGERVRLIFHAFKPLRDTEAIAVTRLAEEFVNFQLEFALLHVADDTKLQLFNGHSPGIPIGRTGKMKGLYVPERGMMVALSDNDMLLSATGAKELKRATDGAPVPLRLHLHRASTFRDLRYLGQQVMMFASHSWRGFQPAPMPVTVSYSQLIARHMGKLGKTSRWNPDVLYGRIGTTRWFL